MGGVTSVSEGQSGYVVMLAMIVACLAVTGDPNLKMVAGSN